MCLCLDKPTAEHDKRLMAALTRIKEAGATLNCEKCSFGQRRIKFLGHIIDQEGISADPDKLKAMTAMEAPKNVTELRRFLGVVNHFGKFSANLATLAQPLRELLSKNHPWEWDPAKNQHLRQSSKNYPPQLY